jgi:endonuclease/exonuclease/phosphatase family metal-dependent hydrolase
MNHILRVMSYNIHHGEGMDGVPDLSRYAEIIAAQKPDYVDLQFSETGLD